MYLTEILHLTNMFSAGQIKEVVFFFLFHYIACYDVTFIQDYFVTQKQHNTTVSAKESARTLKHERKQYISTGQDSVYSWQKAVTVYWAKCFKSQLCRLTESSVIVSSERYLFTALNRNVLKISIHTLKYV